MTYWTVLLINILTGPLEGDQYIIPYSTAAACESAMNTVGTTLDYDYTMTCVVTELPTKGEKL